MGKRRFRRTSDNDPERVAPAIDEALRNVRPLAADDEAPVKGGQTDQESETEAAGTLEAEITGLPTQGLLTAEELADRLGGTDAADDASTARGGLKDPTAGLGSARERLADQLASTDPFADAADDTSSSPPGSKYGEGMFAKGGTGQTHPAAPAGATNEEGEVTQVVAGGGKATREGLESMPLVGGALGDLFADTEAAVDKAAGAHERQVNEAADSDPTTGGGSGGSSGQSGGEGSGTPSGSGSDDQDDGTTTIENEDGSTTTVYESGDIVTAYPDGTTEHQYPDGTTETDYPDGTLKTEYPDGSTETIHPDGTTETTPPTESDASEEETDEEETDEEGTDEDGSETDGTETDEKGGGAEMSGDPDEEYAPLPEDIQRMVDADLAAMRQQLQPVVAGDGVTDPDPNADPAFGAGLVAGIAVDPHGELESMLGQPGGPDDMYGSGRPVGGSAPQPDSGVIDPGPDADTGVQTTGPEERDTRHDVTGLAPLPSGSDDSEDESTDDTSGSVIDTLASLSPLRSRIDTIELAAEDDTAEDEPDDAD